MKFLIKFAILLQLATICIFSVSAQDKLNTLNKASDVLNDKNVELEISSLKKLKIADKIKVRRAIEDLEEASLKASTATDLDEIAYFDLSAGNSLEAAVAVIPDGAVKRALVSGNLALGHSFFLRLVSAGKENPNKEDVAKLLEDILIRYKLAKIPKYERPAKVLDLVDLFVASARFIAAEAGIVQKKSDDN